MDINAMVKRAWGNAEAKGWHDKPRSPTEEIMLIVTELAEAVEELRAGRGVGETHFVPDSLKPEGVPSELADVLIRIGDFCGTHGIDLASIVALKMEYNESRPYRHGGKTL